ncbi:hypothetical protein [Streptomyces humicola]|uniref:hypothetical protein n=1 Tax=Streptomyces humicola TaxID=2953240 RepID=UPI003558A7F5
METAELMVASDQPNSLCSGSIITLGTARNPAAPTSVRKTTTAIHQARWMRERRTAVRARTVFSVPVGSGDVCVTPTILCEPFGRNEWPEGQDT